jgi:hypothetical protein
VAVSRPPEPLTNGAVAGLRELVISKTPWPGSARPPTSSQHAIVEIFPIRVLLVNQADLPSARPVLHVQFALLRSEDVVVSLDMDEPFQVIPPGEAVGDPSAMFPNSAGEIGGRADLKRTVPPIGHDVHPAAHCHECG